MMSVRLLLCMLCVTHRWHRALKLNWMLTVVRRWRFITHELTSIASQ